MTIDVEKGAQYFSLLKMAIVGVVGLDKAKEIMKEYLSLKEVYDQEQSGETITSNE